jgi:hypothetical protein
VGTLSCQGNAARTIEGGAVPAIQSAAATLGGLQAEAIVQALHGMHAGHRRVNLDVRTCAMHTYELTRDPRCPGRHRLLAPPPIRWRS